MDHDQAVRETDILLAQENAVIYEAAFRSGSFFVRVDIAVKRGSTLEIIEVKAKSFDPDIEDPFLATRDATKLKSAFAPYLYDVAFQTYVARLSKGYTIIPKLAFVNNKSLAPIDGLNQLFLVRRSTAGSTDILTKRMPTQAEIGDLIIEIDVSPYVGMILESKVTDRKRHEGTTFEEEVSLFADLIQRDLRHPPKPGRICKKCEFRSDPTIGKSGFVECWTQEGRLSEDQALEQFVFDIWNIHHTKAENLLDKGMVLARDVELEDLAQKEKKNRRDDGNGLTTVERQWLQVRKQSHIDRNAIRNAIGSWKYPLHFIDFETASVAIPFHKGMRPYEAIAFQFSHHIVDQDGKISHHDQFICDEPGTFPNFGFLRALKASLASDEGSVFRYAAHENSILCRIHAQLESSTEPDRFELMEWIESLTESPKNFGRSWRGKRNMIDLLELVKRHVYLPDMRGSISLKRVLPAILSQANEFSKKYESAIYGSIGGMKSHNFSDWVWIRRDKSGLVIDPYSLLDPVFEGIDVEKLDLLTGEDDDLADGGAAMTAYSMMQFSEMSGKERQALREALLRYCELDTFAMVLLFEYLCEIST